MDLEEKNGQQGREEPKTEKKMIEFNPFVIIFGVVVFCGLLTFLVTPGTLVDGVYEALPRNAFNFNNLFNIFRAIPYGIKDSANIVILILVVGGALEIYRRSGAIDNGITQMVVKFGGGSRAFLLAILIVVFSAIGGFLGWIEVIIPFVPLVIAVILALGYDSMTAVAVVTVGTMGGFVAGPTNLYTVGVCNGILQNMGLLPEGSDVFVGLGFRTVIWVVITAVSVVYIMLYASRTFKNPELSYVKDVDVSDLRFDTSDAEENKLTIPQILVLFTILGAMILTVIGMKFGINGVNWVIDDVSGAFFLSGIIAALIMKMKASEVSDAFIAGAKSAVGGAMVVGVARGVYWVLNAGNLNATIIYNATNMLEGLSPLVAGIGIIIMVTFMDALVPSGSGKGALLSPILIPIALSLGLSSQTAVLAYQFGDGIANMFWFSYGTLLIFLNYGKVSINKWYKFFVPLMAIFFLIGFISVGVAIQTGF